MDDHGIASGPIRNAERLPGGTQNLLIRFERGNNHYVLRRPSLNPRPEAARTMEREAIVLRALAPTDVPHPRFIAECEDPSVLGARFYLVEAVDGFNAAIKLPPEQAAQPALRHKMGLSLVDGLVRLAKVDIDEVGLASFGKIQGFLERQVPRWAGQLESYNQFAGWSPSPELSEVAILGDWLEANRPAALVPGLMHGDYHIGNVLFRDDCSLAAIVDWELTALGDPLLDLGRLLATWPDEAGEGPLSLKVEPWQGFPTRDELVAAYAEGTKRHMGDLLWFEILSCYKLSIILEGTYARAAAGLADRETGERLHLSALALIRRGLDWLNTRI